MGGRRDDDAPARGALPAVPPRPAPRRPGPVPRPAQQPRAARLPRADQPSGRARKAWLAVGLVLAAVATAAVVVTDNPLVLRIVLLAVCWAFVLAAFLSSGRGGDEGDAAAREAELRAAYELELEREVTARHAHEAELEGRLRRESEESMRGELQQLRSQLSGLGRLQDDLAAVGRLSAQLTDLAELRGELAALAQLRAQLTGVGDLRAELGRLHPEGVEQLSGEVLVERMVMRAQSVRGPAQNGPAPAVEGFAGRTLEGTPDWSAEPEPRAGGWDVDSRATRVDADPAADDAEPRPPTAPPPAEPTRTFAVVDEEQVSRHRPPSPVEWLVGESLVGPWVEPSPRSPREWLDEQSLVGTGDATGELPVTEDPDGSAATGRSPAPDAPRRHRRAAEPDDDHVSWTDRLRGTTPDEPADTDVPSHAAPSSGSSSSDPASGGSSYGSPSYESSPYESPSYVSPSQEGPEDPTALANPSFGGFSNDSPSYPSPSYASPSYGSTAYPSPSYDSAPAEDRGTESYGNGSHEPPSWLDRDPLTIGSTATRDGSAAPDEDGPDDGGPTHQPAGAPPEHAGHARLEQILAESGLAAPSGGRSGRRRYREEGQDDGDDVLARVLGRD
ncbi:hypothetical protein KUM42_13280 [Modestobacter sp. L9-4]|uniref:DUF6779 domain-containing protein n=1 Tax=Modestobacter sp. L9-4 TaxID=2851567 RepID=UPI001C774789|nr:DUF6779 domain-containing protein [Modestobacter sp. L9-4]QXG74831.1 hypothetical protein KUM42_13280 [Modestobacter sp. L9-4]